MKLCSLSLTLLIVVACGGGSDDNSTKNTEISLVVGSEKIDSTNAESGVTTIRFPNADGDHPMITAVLVDGSTADGWADLPNPLDTNYNIKIDGVDIYTPLSGSYTVTLTIEDKDDNPVQRIININIPTSQHYSLAGNIQDGPAGSEVGVNTTVRLFWHPFSTSKEQIITLQSNASGNGSFNFSNLVGNADSFEIRIDGGIN